MANQSPPASSFCADLPVAPEGAGTIRFYGGFQLSSQGDPTRGPPGACQLSVDLLGSLQAALAPLSPFLTLLDAVAALANCFITLTEVVTNPFKIPDLLGCIPTIVAKINKLLALVPIFPQGVLSILEMILDVLNFILTQLSCLLSVLQSIQAQLAELGRLAERLNETDDALIRADLLAAVECGTQNAQTQAGAALGAFGPIARILCAVREILRIVPGGNEIAGYIGIPDPGSISAVQDAINVVASARGVLQVAVAAIVTLGQAVGLELPTSTYKCPPLGPPEPEAPVPELPEPRIDSVVDPATGLVLASIPVAAASTDPDFPIRLVGINFVDGATTKVYWSTSPFPSSKVQVLSSQTQIELLLPADLRRIAGVFQIAVVNEPADLSAPFAGVPATPGGEAHAEVKVSNQVAMEVA